jgi:hypothetical protein
VTVNALSAMNKMKININKIFSKKYKQKPERGTIINMVDNLIDENEIINFDEQADQIVENTTNYNEDGK